MSDSGVMLEGIAFFFASINIDGFRHFMAVFSTVATHTWNSSQHLLSTLLTRSWYICSSPSRSQEVATEDRAADEARVFAAKCGLTNALSLRIVSQLDALRSALSGAEAPAGELNQIPLSTFVATMNSVLDLPTGDVDWHGLVVHHQRKNGNGTDHGGEELHSQNNDSMDQGMVSGANTNADIPVDVDSFLSGFHVHSEGTSGSDSATARALLGHRDILLAMFRLLDRDGNGKVSREEFRWGFQSLQRWQMERIEQEETGLECGEKRDGEKKDVHAATGSDEEGPLRSAALERSISGVQREKPRRGRAPRQRIRRSDSMDDVASISQREADDLFDMFDTDGNGEVNIQEFAERFMSVQR